MATNYKDQEVLINLSEVEHIFTTPSGKTITVLTDINFSLHAGELVAILGPSGCGKSTLIRIATGLLKPARGQVFYRGLHLEGASPNTALVFQQFALYPWLTVAQNIEQALIPRGLPPAERKQRTAEVVTLIGLDGFEEAYPRELSGGMKQRVGIARALAVRPEVLCMDEPFSQVDALTAETLRNEVINLWRDHDKYPQSIFLVSHDIHEVAFMASRILIMTTNPGRIKTVVENSLPYPRDPRSPEYQILVDRLHNIITGLYMPEEQLEVQPVAVAAAASPLTPLPLVEVRDVIGLLETVKTRGGRVQFYRLTAEMGRAFTQILLASKAAELLKFLETPEDDLVLTDLGRQFISAAQKMRKQLFRTSLTQLPLIKRVQDLLANSSEQRIDKEVLLEELAIQCPEEDPKRLFRILINWGRYADLWLYQSANGSLMRRENTLDAKNDLFVPKN